MYEAVQSERPLQPFASHVNIDQLTIDNNEVNPYHKGLCAMVDTELFQEPRLEMDKCNLNRSILSTNIDYTTHRDLDSPYKGMNTSILYNKLGDDDNLVSGPTEISDERFQEVSCCLKTTAYYDDTNDVSTTYLSTYHAGNKPRAFNFENHIPMDGRSYLSHTYYKATRALHKLAKFTTTCTGIKIGNGSIVQVLFVIPLLFMCHGHVFEIYTIVADIDDGIDLVFGFKNMIETEGMLNTRTGEFDFLRRSIPIFPKLDLNVKPGGKAYMKIRIPFVER